MGSLLSQLGAITAVNLRNLPQRAGPSIVAVVGISGVVMVLLVVLSIGSGFERTLRAAASKDTVVVLQSGSDTEITSDLTLDQTRVIAESPGLRREGGDPLASSELFVAVDVPKKSTGTPAHVPLRGVAPAAFRIREGFRIVEGARFAPGRHELIVGQAATAQFSGLERGSVHEFGGASWTVVGIFAAGGSAAETEIWCDVHLLQPAYRRDTFQSVYAKLESPVEFAVFRDALARDARMDVRVFREDDYFASQSRALTTSVRAVAAIAGVLMAVCATLCALNTMHSAVAVRTQEIATLRAIGFGSGPVVVSVLAEAVALAILGGSLGTALAYLLFDGYQASTMNWQTFTQVAFAFRVTPELAALGIAYALGIGAAGAVIPALHAARLPVSAALRGE